MKIFKRILLVIGVLAALFVIHLAVAFVIGGDVNLAGSAVSLAKDRNIRHAGVIIGLGGHHAPPGRADSGMDDSA